jgi:hypothetical protein
MSAALPLVRRPVVPVVQIETVNMRLLIVEAVEHKGLEGNRQLFPMKYLLKTVVGIALIERNAVLPYLANKSVATMYLHEHSCSCVERDAYIEFT